jgi:Family of unknown function (DUF6186)
MREITIAGFLLCLLAAITVELLARRDPEWMTPFDGLLDRVMATRSARVGILLFWWWVGWHFLVGPTV